MLRKVQFYSNLACGNQEQQDKNDLGFIAKPINDMEIYSGIASILALIGYHLIIQTDKKQRLIGVSIKLIVAIMMHIYFVKLENWSFVLLNIFYLGLDLRLLKQLFNERMK